MMLVKDGENSWNERVRNDEALLRVKEERHILHAIKTRKAEWIGYIFYRNCHLKRTNEGNIQDRLCDGKARKKTSTSTA
jgi:hypothetical protein